MSVSLIREDKEVSLKMKVFLDQIHIPGTYFENYVW